MPTLGAAVIIRDGHATALELPRILRLTLRAREAVHESCPRKEQRYQTGVTVVRQKIVECPSEDREHAGVDALSDGGFVRKRTLEARALLRLSGRSRMAGPAP